MPEPARLLPPWYLDAIEAAIERNDSADESRTVRVSRALAALSYEIGDVAFIDDDGEP